VLIGEAMNGLLFGFKEYGIMGIVIATVFFMLWRMIVWVMEFVKTQNLQHADERKTWQITIMNINDNIHKVGQGIDEHRKADEERGRYIREEHKEMIASLGRINGYTK